MAERPRYHKDWHYDHANDIYYPPRTQAGEIAKAASIAGGAVVAVLLIVVVAFSGCRVPFEPQPWNECQKLQRLYDANVVLTSELDAAGSGGVSGYAVLNDGRRHVWASTGSAFTKTVHGKTHGQVEAKLADQMRPGVVAAE